MIAIELYPEAAPNAAQRFEELVKSGFYDNTPVFRIVPGFVAQFGINSEPKHIVWKTKLFNDDPSLFRLQKGTLAFAKGGPNTNSTQVFINYNDNSQALVPQNFTAFGKITKGMEIAEGFKAVGDPSMGLSQDELWKNTQGYLKALPEKPNMIVKAEIVK
jgi:cyclophilin family peptidyl-prolyl cis-trans isomerase